MKERIREAAGSYFISVTLINAAMLILGSLLSPQQRFGYEAFLYPLIYGLIGIIPGLIISTDKELSVKQLLIRKAMQMLLIIVLLLAFMFGDDPLNRQTIFMAAAVALSVVVIYILVNVIMWMLDARTAKSMTEDLKRFQQGHEKSI